MTLDLVVRWRTEATLLKRRGAPAQGDVLLACADELEVALRLHALERLTPRQAAEETGYTASAIRKLFPGQRTIPRSALPKKARYPGPGEPDEHHKKGVRVAKARGAGHLGRKKSRRPTPQREAR